MTGRLTATRARRRAKRTDGESPPQDGGLVIRDESGGIVHAAPPRVTARIRYLLARIQLNDAAGLPARLAFTSALQGEGVTYVTRTLAAVIAHDLRRSVCVVDLNWWPRRSRSSADSDSGSPGLADVLQGHRPLDDVLVSTNDPLLTLLPAGDVPVPLRPVIAVNSLLDDLLVELSGRFDHLLLELPAVLRTSDALTLVRLCDAYALVVRHGVTTEAQVREALDELSGAVSLGIVLNRESTRVPRRIARLLSE
jgi:Mrp family chromosome partitioning ATPase